MNSRFERLYSLPNQLYSPTAPVIITAGALLKDTQTDRVLAQLKIKNISPKIIKAVSVSLLPLDTAMRTLGERETYQLLDLSAGRDTEFGQKTPLYLSNNAARAYQVIIDDVVFSDNTVWQSDGAVLSDLPSQKSAADALADAELAKQYKLEFGENADYMADACFDLWRCHCGAVNHDDEVSCHSCNASKEAVLSFDIEQLKRNCDSRIAQLERASQESRAVAKKRAKLACVIIAVFLGILGLIWAYTEVIAPTMSYKKAADAYSKGDYLTAIAEYEGLDEYKDSKDRLEESITAYADSLFNAGEYQSAIEYYEQLVKKDDEKIQECHYRMMDEAITKSEWDEAEKEYSFVKGYKDADDKSTSIIVGKVEKLINENNYLAADKLLNQSQSESENILSLKKKVKYCLAVGYFEGSNGQKQDYIKAADAFSELIDDTEYGAEAKESLYLCAIQIYENSSTKDKALNYFKEISDYKDSKGYLEAETQKKNLNSSSSTATKPQSSTTAKGTQEYIPKLSWYMAFQSHEDTISISGYDPNGKYIDKEFFSHIGVYKDGKQVSGAGDTDGYRIVCQNSAPDVVDCYLGGYSSDPYWNTITATPLREGTATITLYLYQIVSEKAILIDTWYWNLKIIP